MLTDARQLPLDTVVATTVCVVGSGAAGITVALELAASGVDVVLLEAGGIRGTAAIQSTLRAGPESTGAHDPLDRVRQKRLGGTTTQWGGRCLPLDELDFAERPHVPHSGWPFDRQHLEPFYRRAHGYLAVGEFEYAARRATADATGLLAGAAGSSDIVDDDRIWRWSPPVKFGQRFRAALTASHRVRVLTHASAVELVQAPGQQRVTEARVAVAPGRCLLVRACVFVVAAGGLECARLLLASSATTPAGIGNASGWLGATYMTHPVAEVGELRLNDPGRAGFGEFGRTLDGVYCRRLLSLRPQVQRREGLLNAGFALWYPDPTDAGHRDGLLSAYAVARWALTRSRLDWKAAGVQSRYGRTPDLGAHVGNIGRELPRVLGFGGRWVRDRWLAERSLPSFYSRPAAGTLRLRFDAEQAPDPGNRVELSRDRDELGMPRLAVHYAVSQSDRHSMLRSVQLLGAELARTGVGRLVLPEPEALLHQEFTDGTHQMGVTRMSSSPSLGVVDADCRVHGTPNLYVASSAVFPTGGMCGPTLSITALAIRLADHLARTLRAL